MKLFLIYIGLCLFSIVLSLFLHRICKNKGIGENKVLLLCYIFHFMLIALLSIFLLEPGAFTPDVEFALDKARTGYWRDLHPHGLTMAFWLTEKFIMPGPLPLLTIQIIFLAAGTVGIFSMSNPKSVKQNIILSGLVFFFPPSFTLFGMLWKDILNVALYLFATFLALMYRKLKTKHYKLMSLGGCIILLSFGVLVRLNAPLAALPIVLFAFWPNILCSFTRYSKRISIVTLSTIIVSLMLHQTTHILSDPPYYLSFASVKRHELAYMACKTGEIKLLEFNTWAEGLSLRKLEEIYGVDSYSFYYSSSPFVQSMHLFKYPWIFNRQWEQEISKRYIRTIIRNPWLWFKYKANNFFGVLGVGIGPQGQANLSDPAVGTRFGIRVIPRPMAFKFGKIFIEPMQQNFLMRPWIYFILSFLLISFICFFAIPTAGLALTLVASGILMELSFLCIVSHYEFRWSHYMIFMCSVVLGLLCRDYWAKRFNVRNKI